LRVCDSSPHCAQGELFDKILSVTFDFPDPEWTNVSANAKDFIKNLLVKDPKQRYTAEQALQHAWIKVRDVSWCSSDVRALRTRDRLREPRVSCGLLNQLRCACAVGASHRSDVCAHVQVRNLQEYNAKRKGVK
jgi:serine/threonine protein kinase